MKKYKRNSFLVFLLLLIGALVFKYMLASSSDSYQDLVDFSDLSPPNYGSRPYDSVILSPKGDLLYGMTSSGGAHDHGCIFSLSTDGSKTYTDLVNFTDTAFPYRGGVPYGSLTLSPKGDLLYGMTAEGGAYGYGCIFCVTTDQNHTYTTLLDFTDTSPPNYGAYPQGTLTLSPSGDLLYGMASEGGRYGYGCVFSITTDEKHTYTNLLDFTHASPPHYGAYPYDSLTISKTGDMLYGMTSAGGGNHHGCIFSLSTDDKHTYTDLVDFTDKVPPHYGALPYGSLTLSPKGDVLYGMTSEGGSHGLGCVFSVKTDGTSYTDLIDFTDKAPNYGVYPQGSLILSSSGDMLYGMTYAGGAHGYGCVFQVTTDEHHTYKDLLDFTQTAPHFGAYPQGSLVLSPSGDKLYGMTAEGGVHNFGCVFSITIGEPTPPGQSPSKE